MLECKSLSFQDNFFRKMVEAKKGENIMISPLSLYQALSLLCNGASGETQKEILKVLYPDKNKDIEAINNNIKELISTLESENSKDSGQSPYCLSEEEDCQIHFNDVNAIFKKKEIELTDQFQQICHNYNTSFSDLISAEQINNFFSEQTNGKINKIIEYLNPMTVLILINAIYFKGTWVDKFNEKATVIKKFINYNKTVVKTHTMHQEYSSQLYYEDKDVQIISLPYIHKTLDFSMIIILPNIKKYASPLEYLNEQKKSLNEIVSKLESKPNVHLYLPRFKYKFKETLNDILTNLGMKSAFSQNSANFENLCQNSQTYVNQILQSTYIDVNENGTEAAAVTLVEMAGAAFHEEEYFMNVNHSFIYMIKSNKIKDADNQNLMPFIGVVNYLEGVNGTNQTNDDDNGKDDPRRIYPHNNEYILKMNILSFVGLLFLILS